MPEGTVATVPTDRISMKPLDEVSVGELEKLLSIPLDTLALKVLQLDRYGELIGFLPWNNRREVALKLLRAVDNAGAPPQSVKEIGELFTAIEPVLRDEHQQAGDQHAASRTSDLMAGLGVGVSTGNPIDEAARKGVQADNASVSKLVQLLDHDDTDVVYEMLSVAKLHINKGGNIRNGQVLVAVVFSALRLGRRVFDLENPPAGTSNENKEDQITSSEKPITDEVNTIEGQDQGETKESVESQNESEEKEADEDTSADIVGEGNAVEVDSKLEDSKTEENTDAGKEEGANVPSKQETVQKGEKPEEVAAPSKEETNEKEKEKKPEEARVIKSVSCRRVFIFIQQTIATLAVSNAELGLKLYLEAARTAGNFFDIRKDAEVLDDYGPIAYELISQAFSLYELAISDSNTQQQCIVAMSGTLLACRALSRDDYERLITKTTQYAAKLIRKPDQCQLVASCAHLFYPVGQGDNIKYSNPQRALECLQRSLKLADACTSMNPANVSLFVDLLDHYVYFFEKKNPLITNTYITGLVSLIKEHFNNLSMAVGTDSVAIAGAKTQYLEIVQYIKRKREEQATAELFASINLD